MFFKRYNHKLGLVFANQDKFIDFSGSYKEYMQNLVIRILKDNGIYSDKAYKAILKEYNRNYTIYDRIPELLICKIPVVIIEVHGHDIKVMDPTIKKIIGLLRTSELNIPSEFKIPKPILDVVTERWYKVKPYIKLKENDLYNEPMEYIAEYIWLSNWNKYYPNISKINLTNYYYLMYASWVSLAGDNKQTVMNILKRENNIP